MAITITQTPHSPFDMAYGANPITLSNIDNNADKYALRIYVVGQTEPIADIRQTPNRVGRAIFDIQNILQSQVGPMVNNIDSLNYQSFQSNTRLALAGRSLVEYQIATAEETGGIVAAARSRQTQEYLQPSQVVNNTFKFQWIRILIK